MLFGKNTSIEHLISLELQRGPRNTALLIAQIKQKRPKTTKQGVYAALRNLRREEIVVLHNKKVSFNVRWLKQMDQFFAIAEQHYLEENFGKDNFLNLKDGEKILYFFKSPAETDKFWGHALILLAESGIPTAEPAYLYNPHEWFLIARRESERECFALITKNRRLLVTVGSKTPLDRAIVKEFDGAVSQYHMLERSLFLKNNYYFNVVGEFLIEVHVDQHIATSIETLYKKSGELNSDVRAELLKIAGSRGRSKLVISRNAKKAEHLKNMLKKNFYIPAKYGAL